MTHGGPEDGRGGGTPEDARNPAGLDPRVDLTVLDPFWTHGAAGLRVAPYWCGGGPPRKIVLVVGTSRGSAAHQCGTIIRTQNKKPGMWMSDNKTSHPNPSF